MLTVKGLNSRLRRIKEQLTLTVEYTKGDNTKEYKLDTYYKNLISDLKSDDAGAYITESGYISNKIIKNENAKMLMASLESKINTVTDLLDEIRENEDDTRTKRELVIELNKRELGEKDYEAALALFYNAKPGDLNAKLFQEWTKMQSDHEKSDKSEDDIINQIVDIENFIKKLGGINNEDS